MKVETMIRTASLAAACVFGAAAVSAQGSSAPAAVPATKVGVINVRQAIVNTAEGKQASAELQSQFAPRQNEIEGMNKQINDLRQRLAAGERTLSDEEKTRLTQQGQKLTQRLERVQNEFQEDVNGAQSEVIDRIGRKMLDVLDRYARENGYVAVFDTSSQNSPILYASNQVDLTQDIIRLYDQAYPVKAGAPAPAVKPAVKPAAKPAAPPAQQKPPEH